MTLSACEYSRGSKCLADRIGFSAKVMTNCTGSAAPICIRAWCAMRDTKAGSFVSVNENSCRTGQSGGLVSKRHTMKNEVPEYDVHVR